MSHCMGPATCLNPLCQTEIGCRDFFFEVRDGFRSPDLRMKLSALAAEYGCQEVVNAALAIKEDWDTAKRIREAK